MFNELEAHGAPTTTRARILCTVNFTAVGLLNTTAQCPVCLVGYFVCTASFKSVKPEQEKYGRTDAREITVLTSAITTEWKRKILLRLSHFSSTHLQLFC